MGDPDLVSRAPFVTFDIGAMGMRLHTTESRVQVSSLEESNKVIKIFFNHFRKYSLSINIFCTLGYDFLEKQSAEYINN